MNECHVCSVFRQEVPIKEPKDLQRIMKFVMPVAQSGGLQIVSGVLEWDDFIDCELLCAQCHLRFRLSCETYHGAGGQWQPVPS
jgi:hypothetical protein